MKILNVISQRFEDRSTHFVTFIFNGEICQGCFTQYDDENTPLKQIILKSLTAG